MPQLVVIDDIFIAQRDAKIRCPNIVATLCSISSSDRLSRKYHETDRSPDGLVRGSQLQPAASEVILPPSKGGQHRAPRDSCKSEQIRAALCSHRDPLILRQTVRGRAPIHLSPLRNPG